MGAEPHLFCVCERLLGFLYINTPTDPLGETQRAFLMEAPVGPTGLCTGNAVGRPPGGRQRSLRGLLFDSCNNQHYHPQQTEGALLTLSGEFQQTDVLHFKNSVYALEGFFSLIFLL